MADAEVMYFSKFQGGLSMSNPIVHLCPYDVVEVTLKMKVAAGATVYIGSIGATVATADDYGDLEDYTVGTDELNEAMYIVLDTMDNIKQLKKDNSVYAATKLLFFSANSYIDVMILIPGSIVEVRLNAAEDAIVKPGLMVYTAALGGVKLEDGCTYLNNVGKVLCDVVVSTADELIIIVVTW